MDVQTPINRPGNKLLYINEILKYIVPCKFYLEPFLGTGIVFYNVFKRNLFKFYRLNDKDKKLMMIYNVLKDDKKRKRLRVLLKNFICYEESLRYFKEIIKSDSYKDDVEFAFAYIILTKNTISKSMVNFHIDRIIKKYLPKDFIQALKSPNVIIFNRDYKFFLEIFKSHINDSFIYIDPPYTKNQSGYNDVSTNELIQTLKKYNNAMQLISYDLDISKIDNEFILLEKLKAKTPLKSPIYGSKERNEYLLCNRKLFNKIGVF